MRTRRLLALALSLVMLMSVALPMAVAADPLPRLAGADRVNTAIEISQEGWEDGSDFVVLVNGYNYPDALAAVPFAFALDAPILLTEDDELNADTADEIERLGASFVYVIGGETVVSKDVVEALDVDFERIAGDTREETAALVAAALAGVLEENGEELDTAMVVYGYNYADALAAASYAAQNGFAILLTNTDAVDENITEAAEELGLENFFVVGGTTVVSEAVEDELDAERIEGDDRFGTAIALAEHFGVPNNMFFATGLGYADALTGGVLAAKLGTGIMLVAKHVPTSVASFMNNNDITTVTLLGGTAAVSNTVAGAIKNNLVVGIGGITGWTNAEAVTIAGKTVAPEDGFYKVSGVAPGEHTAYFSADGYETVEEEVVVVKDRLTVLNKNVAGKITTVTISGVVADSATGAPVEDAKATLETWDADAKDWAEDVKVVDVETTGEFSFSTDPHGVVDDGKYRVTISRVDDSLKDVYHSQVAFEGTLDEEKGTYELGLIELDAVEKMTISGTIKDKDGELFKSESVMLAGLDKEISATVDAEDGTFEFKDITLPNGQYDLTFDANDGVNAIYEAKLTVKEGTDFTHNINLVGGYAINFELRSSNTEVLNPITESWTAADNISVALYSGETKITNMTITDYDNISTALVAPGTYTIKVDGTYLIAQEYTVKVTNDDVRLAKHITPAGAIEVTVSADEVADFEGAVVDLLDEDGEVFATGTVAEGETSYLFKGLPVGEEFTSRVTFKGHVVEEFGVGDKAVKVAVNDTKTVAAALTALPVFVEEVSGFVRLPNGAPAYVDAENFAKVYFYAKDVVDLTESEKQNKTVKYDKNTELHVAEVVSNGSYEVLVGDELEPGTYTVVVRYAGYENYVTTMTLEAGQESKFNNFKLVEGGNATLDVVVNKGESTATPTIKDEFGVELSELYETNADGVWVGLPAGTYTITSEESGYKKLNAETKLRKGEDEELEFDLEEIVEGSVTLWLVDNNYKDIENVKIVVDGEVIFDSEEDTFNNGEAAISLPEGNYTATIYVPGHLTETVEFTVSEDAEVNEQVVITLAE